MQSSWSQHCLDDMQSSSPQHGPDDGQTWNDENTQWQSGGSRSHWQQTGNDWQQSTSHYSVAHYQGSHGRAKWRAKWPADEKHESNTAQVAMATDTTKQKSKDEDQRLAQNTIVVSEAQNKEKPEEPTSAVIDHCALPQYVASVTTPGDVPSVVPPPAANPTVTHTNCVKISDREGNETWISNTVYSNGMSVQTAMGGRRRMSNDVAKSPPLLDIQWSPGHTSANPLHVTMDFFMQFSQSSSCGIPL